MGYLGSPQHIVEMFANYIRAKITGQSDRSDRELIVSGALSALSFSSSLLVCQRFLFFCRPNTDPAGDE
jgi:hypothetical protein